METTSDRVRAVIAHELSVDIQQVTDTASIDVDLGADSLDTIELIMALEQEFGIEISEEEFTFDQVGAIIQYVDRRVHA